MKKINSLIPMTFANTVGSGITAVFWFVIAGLLLPEEYGEIHYFISIAGIAYTIFIPYCCLYAWACTNNIFFAIP